MKQYIGDSKKILIHRDTEEVIDSMRSIGIPIDKYRKELLQTDRELKETQGLHIKFNEINENLERISEYLDIPFEQGRADIMINIQLLQIF